MAHSFDDLQERFNRIGLGGNRAATGTNLVIGIDFGTTYTGVAYSHSTSFASLETIADWTLDQVRDRITIIRDWPNADLLYPDKARTILAYENGVPVAWGGDVSGRHSAQVTHFKLGLQEGISDTYSPGFVEQVLSVLGGFIRNHLWRHPRLPDYNAVDFAADYLRLVRKHVLEKSLPLHLGSVFLENQHIRYVISVPAMWDDKARSLTRVAAERAGIPSEDLTLVTEPEAAALYCSTLCRDVDLTDGDRFLICDAGGGTVDLISYEIITLSPFRIEECAIGSGGACGAVYITRAFETFLADRLGDRRDILTERMLTNAVKAFEGGIKFQFDPYAETCEPEYEIPLRGAPDIPEIDLYDGYLTIRKNELMQQVFIPTFTKITEIVRNQMLSVQPDSSSRVVFLVGGLGSNKFLLKFLQSRIGTNGVTVKQPDGGHTAIMRGAVIYGVGLKVDVHRMRRHYGIALKRLFQEGHREDLKSVGHDGRTYCTNTMEWKVKKSEVLHNGHKMETRYVLDHWTEHDWNRSECLFADQILYVCEQDSPAVYRDDRSVRELCALTVDVKKLPPAAIKRKYSPRGYFYYEFKLLYDDTEYGSVKTSYSESPLNNALMMMRQPSEL